MATSFSTSDPKIAYNIIMGISNIGAEGIDKLLENGKSPDEIKKMIFAGVFAKPADNIYWIFTQDEIDKFAWINYFGTWDFNLKKGSKSFIWKLSNCRKDFPGLICNKFKIDFAKGRAYTGKYVLPLRKTIIKYKDNLVEKTYSSSKGFYLEIIQERDKAFIFLMPEQVYMSMFNQMYILRSFNKNYFELVYDNFPTMVLYHVRSKASSLTTHQRREASRNL